MNETDIFVTMARYNRWINKRLYKACTGMSDDERKLDVKAFFGSIHRTLNHILLVDRIWLGRLAGQTFPVSSLDQELYAEFATLTQERSETDSEIEGAVSHLSPEALNEPITYRSIVQGRETTLARGVVLLHLFNHQTHHRGQVTSLISQLGHDYGVTDLIACPLDTPPD